MTIVVWFVFIASFDKNKNIHTHFISAFDRVCCFQWFFPNFDETLGDDEGVWGGGDLAAAAGDPGKGPRAPGGLRVQERVPLRGGGGGVLGFLRSFLASPPGNVIIFKNEMVIKGVEADPVARKEDRGRKGGRGRGNAPGAAPRSAARGGPSPGCGRGGGLV